MAKPLKNRHDFVLFFDVENGNPNGDPDSGNMPRIDVETGHGLVTDVCIKRKVRNFVDLVKKGAQGYRIYIQDNAILNQRNEEAYKALNLSPTEKGLKPEDIDPLTRWMCEQFFDIRAFGAVMSTKINCGQVRGPVQLTFARSCDPVVPSEITITRMAVADGKEDKSGSMNHTMGRKYIIPYGLYRMEGFISAPLAEKTGFSEDDLELFLSALKGMFENDHSAARGKMNTRSLFVFRHESPLGDAPAQQLFDLIRCRRRDPSVPPRHFSDYEIGVAENNCPKGVSLDGEVF